ncbi:lipid A core-O-antigen ligase-like enyme [Thermanaerovibrio velox DSM 12556]|uniref:Lipid A core-O-antigen ligase-like enyme n=1 Tax=Thermanaerovibrio velox DSM 12556 TaxID=926567 RepID=H0UQ21_9BACT|nr:O-antigen ligase family protein [Thermanaerovibrio velox]EHM09650.1 lipid A core-O-antigen ligase-like enyme [Thermanaerovibrio velox DSM 12556]
MGGLGVDGVCSGRPEGVLGVPGGGRYGRWFDASFLGAFLFTVAGPVPRYLFFAAALAFFFKARLWRSVAGVWGLVPWPFRWGLWTLIVFGLVSELAGCRGLAEVLKGYSLVLEPFLGGLMGFAFFLRRGSFRRWMILWPWVLMITLLAVLCCTVGPFASREIGGALSHKGMWYAAPLAVTLAPVALSVFALARGWGRALWWGVVFVLCALCALVGRSSAGIIGFAVGVLVAASCFLRLGRGGRECRRLGGLALLALLVASAVLIGSSTVRGYVMAEAAQIWSLRDALRTGDFEMFTTFRNLIWRMGMDLFSQRPLVGWGWGRLDRWAPLVRDPALRERWVSVSGEWPSHLHNDFMELLVSMGVLGGAVYLGLAYGFLRMSAGVVVMYRLRHPCAVGLAGAMLGALVWGMAGGVIAERSVSGMFYWTLWGALMGLYCRGCLAGLRSRA